MTATIIRPEAQADFRTVEELTREAFWNVYKPGCDEHLIMHKMRDVPAFVADLDFVATEGDQIVGNVVATEAKVVANGGGQATVLCLGPIAVLPSHQGRGIGSELMNHVMKRARELGYRGIVLFGNPRHYARFGFKNAEEYQIQTAAGSNLDAFMAAELYDGALAGVQGRFHADPVFEVDEHELLVFDGTFPPKEKLVTDTQLTQLPE